MIIYFWRDWVRIIKAFFASLAHVISPAPGTKRFQPQTTDQLLAWMIILATIPVGLAGVALEHTVRTVFTRPVLTASFLFVNGLILLAGEQARQRSADMEAAGDRRRLEAVSERQRAAVAAGVPGSAGGRHSARAAGAEAAARGHGGGI